MDKAARAVRRSSVRLMTLGGGHSDLSVLISEVRDMRNTAKAFMTAQNSAAQYMLKWAENEENRAVQDVVAQLAELNLVWTEVQKDLCEHLKEFRQMFEMILDGDKHVSQAKHNLTTCDMKETKIRKELKKAAKRATPQEIQILEHRLSQAERAKDIAQLEVADRVRNNEAIKLVRLKEGMLQFSEAYIDYGRKCSMLFEAQRDIAYQIPDVHGRDYEDIKYTGSGATKFYVQKAKENMRQYRRQSQPTNSTQTSQQPDPHDDPPPPYTPADYLRHPDSNPISTPALHYPHDNSMAFQTHDTQGLAHQGALQDEQEDCDDLSGAMGAAKL
ncbi:uncharacterized protein LOC135467871 [Liolophura sinensis]|uniref:uncharacterized protein LOC135467871 n=1 Tax=Liolophura sinensis TaxID=3198878 RepID=UPI0031582722